MEMRWLILAAAFLATAGNARVDSIADVAKLPAYCWGTQQIQTVSRDPTPIIENVRRYGEIYKHLHHYCWALDAENKAASMIDVKLAQSTLKEAIKDIDYVLNKNPSKSFVLLPEIYTTKARFLFKLDQQNDAVIWLKKAIQLGSGYVPAYARLSDYYVQIGNTAEAVKILKEGISHGKHPDLLKRRLKLLEGAGKDN